MEVNILTALLTLAAIDFASPAMLGWLAAAALPWLINLWSRRRHVEIPWAAVDLLLTAVQERSRRLRLRELLLLALRTAILVLVALAAARPLWRQSTAAGLVAARTHHVIVLDQSFSMATRAQDSSRFERAKARARQIVEDAPAGDAFTVIAWSETADNTLGRPTFEPAAALAAIDSLEPLDTIANLPAAARAVDAAVTAAKKEFPGLTRTRTVYISDLGLNTWSAELTKTAGAPTKIPSGSLPLAGRAGEGVGSGYTLQSPLPNPPRQGEGTGRADENQSLPREDSRFLANAIIESVDEGARSNFAITNITLDPPLPILDRPITINVQLKSFNAKAPTTLNVELLLDGARLGQQSATLQPNAEATLRFETRLVDPGNHVFEARLPEDADLLAVDNRRWLSLEATRGPRVLCVADEAGGAEDVARALNPRYREGASEDAISVETITTAGLASADLPAYDAIFLANIAELSAREQRLLDRYVANGGAAVIILGNRIRPAAYNEFLGRARLLPSRNQASGSAGASPSQNPEPSQPVLQIANEPVTGDWRLDPLDYRHPILKPFAGRTRAGLLGVRISQYYPLRINSEEDAPTVALAFTSGDPALIIGDHGQGRLALLATDPALATGEEPWSTFAVSPSFVPLVRELFAHLTADRRTERLNRIAGEPLTPYREGEAPAEPQPGARLGGSLALPVTSANLRWRDPAGVVTRTPPATNHRGIYTLERDGAPALSIAVNVDPSESDLTSINAAELQQQSSGATASRTATAASYAGAIPLQHYLLAAAAALVLIELTTAWLFGRGWA